MRGVLKICEDEFEHCANSQENGGPKGPKKTVVGCEELGRERTVPAPSPGSSGLEHGLSPSVEIKGISLGVVKMMQYIKSTRREMHCFGMRECRGIVSASGRAPKRLGPLNRG